MSKLPALSILGAGGHGRVVADTWLAMGGRVSAFYDDDLRVVGNDWQGIPVMGSVADWAARGNGPAIIGVGNNAIRRSIAESYPDAEWVSVVHPSAVIAGGVSLAAGSVVFAGAVVQVDTRVGVHTILNTRCSVDHDSEVRAFSHVGPGASICGGVTLGEGVLVGVGAAVRPLISVGPQAVIGAGAAVVCDVPAGETWCGVPARKRDQI